MSTFNWIILYSLLAMTINTVGIFTIYKNQKWALDNKEHFMCFAAGILITSPLLFAFPESISLNNKAPLAALLGFLFMYFSNQITSSINKQKSFTIVALLGIGLHSLIDGAIYSVTFSSSVTMGMLAGAGLIAHEFAEGVITFAILTESGTNKRKAILVAFLVAALTTPIGAIISYPIINHWSSGMTGLSLGFVTGVLIYTSASHLLPEVQESGKRHSHISLVVGVLVAIGMHLLH